MDGSRSITGWVSADHLPERKGERGAGGKTCAWLLISQVVGLSDLLHAGCSKAAYPIILRKGPTALLGALAAPVAPETPAAQGVLVVPAAQVVRLQTQSVPAVPAVPVVLAVPLALLRQGREAPVGLGALAGLDLPAAPVGPPAAGAIQWRLARLYHPKSTSPLS